MPKKKDTWKPFKQNAFELSLWLSPMTDKNIDKRSRDLNYMYANFLLLL